MTSGHREDRARPSQEVSGTAVGGIGAGWGPCTSLAYAEAIRSLTDIYDFFFFPSALTHFHPALLSQADKISTRCRKTRDAVTRYM